MQVLHDYKGWKKVFESERPEQVTYLAISHSGIDFQQEVVEAVSGFFSQFSDLTISNISASRQSSSSYLVSTTIEVTTDDFGFLFALGGSNKKTYFFNLRVFLDSSTLRENDSESMKLVDSNEKNQTFAFAFYGDRTSDTIEELMDEAFSERKIREKAHDILKKTVRPSIPDGESEGTVRDISSLNQQLIDDIVILDEKESALSSLLSLNFSLYFLLIHLRRVLKISREDVRLSSVKQKYDQTFKKLRDAAENFNSLSDTQKNEFVNSLVSFQNDLSKIAIQSFRLDKRISSQQLSKTFALLSDADISEIDLEKYYLPSHRRET